jgi:hypothetical protein
MRRNEVKRKTNNYKNREIFSYKDIKEMDYKVGDVVVIININIDVGIGDLFNLLVDCIIGDVNEVIEVSKDRVAVKGKRGFIYSLPISSIRLQTPLDSLI